MEMGKAVEAILQNAERNISKHETDYRDDEGLLCCGKCHTRKQTRIEVLGQMRMPYCLCECEAAKRDAEEQAFKDSQRKMRIEKLRHAGFPDGEMCSWTFAKDDKANKALTDVAMRYVNNFKDLYEKGKGLLLYGNIGNGKTFMAACIANALIDEGYSCLVTNFARLTNTIGGMYSGKQEYIDSLGKYDLLVIDDLAAERDTEYMNEIVYNIIDSRYRSGKPLIVTTNLTPNEIQNSEELRKQRIFSRIQEMCVPIKVVGEDRRKNNHDDDVRRMLGL